MSAFAVLLAAGSGTRFGQDKLLQDLGGKPVWKWSFDSLLAHPSVDSVGIVCSGSNRAAIEPLAQHAAYVLTGGDSRQKSAEIGCAASPGSADFLLIHDAARPFLNPDLVARVLAAAGQAGAAAPALPVTDTIRRAESQGFELLDRTGLLAMQTPQAARRSLMLAAHRQAKGQMTDDLALLEAIGVKPSIVPGDPSGFKITEPSDLERARAILRPMRTRTGFGYDVHRFSPDPNRPLWLGGVRFEGTPGLEGHSDADAALHAVVDAILGAAALGDIGRLFPNTAPRWKDEPSATFLKAAAESAKKAGWSIEHVDLTILAEQPKVSDRVEEMKAAIAHALQIEPAAVSIKATTNEGLGAIGRGEGIAAYAVATLTAP